MSSPERRTRGRYALATLAAGAVAVVFATVGDGVDSPGETGPVRSVVEFGHQGVWGLLAAAFAVAAARGRWGRVSQVLAVGGGVVYVVFLAAVFFG